MTDETQLPTRQAIEAKGRSGRLKVTGKLKTALDAMIWQAACRADAAKLAGLADHSLRQALRKAHVMAYFNEGLEVLRTGERPRNHFALVKARDHAPNMVSVQAVKALEQIADEASGGRLNIGINITAAGYVLDLRPDPSELRASPRPMVDVTKPVTIEHQAPAADPIFKRPRRE